MAEVTATPALGRLASELAELKRVTRAGRSGSVTARMFARAWARLVDDCSPVDVADGLVTEAMVAVGVGDLEPADVDGCGLDLADLARRAATDAGRPVAWTELVGRAVPWPQGCPAPAFCAALADQPRAGAVSAAGRQALPAPESHADHSAAVATLAALLAHEAGGDRGRAALAGLTHHLHNATLPDIGWRGEVLIGDDAIARLLDVHRRRALDQLPDGVRALAVDAVGLTTGVPTCVEGHAFAVADVVDRVADAGHHAAVASTTLAGQLDADLVHPGPLRDLQRRALADAGWG